MTEDTLRNVVVSKIGPHRFKATNSRGGETFFGVGGNDPDFTPVELLLAAIAGCSAIDVESITHKRATSIHFEVDATGHKVREDGGNIMRDISITFDVRFPEGEDGDAARAVLPESIEMSRDRLCTVSRTVQHGADVTYHQD